MTTFEQQQLEGTERSLAYLMHKQAEFIEEETETQDPVQKAAINQIVFGIGQRITVLEGNRQSMLRQSSVQWR